MKYFLVVAQLFVVCLVNAQSKGSIGFEIGPNIASIRGQNLDKEKLKALGGIFAGVTFGCHFSDQFAVKSGVYYEVKGTKMEVQLEDDKGNFYPETKCKNVFKYVTIPVLMKYTAPNKANFFVNAGPYFAFLIENTLEAQDVPDVGNVKIEQTELYKSNDFGVCFGMGVSVNFGSGWNFQFEIRDNLGLTNIVVDGDSYSVNNNTFNFLPGISYKF